MTTKAKRNRGERLTFAKTAAEVQQSQHFAALKAKYQVTQYEDAEIKRVVRETRDDLKRRQVVDYLLQKDSMRYAWAKSFGWIY